MAMKCAVLEELNEELKKRPTALERRIRDLEAAHKEQVRQLEQKNEALEKQLKDEKARPKLDLDAMEQVKEALRRVTGEGNV
jgi:hypothetical protein